MKGFLEKAGYVVDAVDEPAAATRLLRDPARQYAIVILDYVFGTHDGAEVAEEILSVRPDQFILMYSNDKSREALQASWKAGAVEFLDKSVQGEPFLQILRKWVKRYEDNQPVAIDASLEESQKLIASIGLVGASPKMAEVARLVTKFKNERSTVLLLGQSGTGKERIAAALHANKHMPFRAVNCASYNGEATLMESELFGIEKDSFTGASRDKKGVFEDVGHGTVFLDEIHTLSTSAQQKLLRVLQEKKVRPVGSTREVPVHFRLIAAAKPDLESRTRTGEFLPDLYYRLNVLRIEVPTLSERKEDILPLTIYFANQSVRPNREPKKFSGKVLDCFRRYPWPGNVRELENTIERICATATGDLITENDLDAKFFHIHPAQVAISAPTPSRELVLVTLRDSRSQREAARKLGMSHSSFHDLLRKLELLEVIKGRSGPKPTRRIAARRKQ